MAGARIEVLGRVEEYQGELEIIPEAGGVMVTSPSSDPVPLPTAVPVSSSTAISDVTPAQVGQTVTVRGTLGEKQTFSAGIKFLLDDGSGVIILLLWQNVYDAIPDASLLAAGVVVEVTGEVEEYQGDLEIIPEADGVRVVE